MLRLITARRLQALGNALAGYHVGEIQHAHVEERLRLELAMARQSVLAVEKDRDEWKARASKFIDQVGVTSGILSSPVMGSPDGPAAHDTRRIFSAMGRTELSTTTEAPRPSPSAGILGVDETAAKAAISGALAGL